MNNKLSERWIFQSIQPNILINWIANLKYFHFIRAIGGHANDGDAFVCELKFNSEDEVFSILKKIGVENFGYNLIENKQCYISIKNTKVEFSISGANGNPYEVSQKDYEYCKKIESLFNRYNLHVYLNLDIENQVNCISKKNYPELFQ